MPFVVPLAGFVVVLAYALREYCINKVNVQKGESA